MVTTYVAVEARHARILWARRLIVGVKIRSERFEGRNSVSLTSHDSPTGVNQRTPTTLAATRLCLDACTLSSAYGSWAFPSA